MSTPASVYDVAATLALMDAGIARLAMFGGLALVFNLLYFGAALYGGFKHKTYTVPLCGTLLFIPHDLLYVTMFDKWFHTYDHWFPKLFWFGLIATNLIEFGFLYQVLKWGREELMPQASQRTFQGVVLLGLVGTSVAWLCIKQVLADELWLFTFGFTVWLAVAFVIPLMLRRNSSAGQSMFLWLSFIGMTLSYWATVWPLDPFFRSPAWLGVGVVIICWTAATIYVMKLTAPAARTAAAAGLPRRDALRRAAS
jgi:hypothetical protein